ncbi:MAG TPA: 8-amino-7-oxononanoate synthase [Abditibacteriaceae bacterium]|jgi:8-amino-7-oxononanoate synthase
MLIDELRFALQQKENAGLRRNLRAVPNGVLDLASNDYLGLSRHPEVIKAACNALTELGCGARASRLVSGHTKLHEKLETALSAYKGGESALAFSSGYQANLSVITALARRGDILFCDKRNHASLIDACRLSSANGATVRYYHSSQRLQELLESYAKKRSNERFLIVSDTVYSMDGDLADLTRLDELSSSFEAVLILDDAHAVGTLETKSKVQESSEIIWVGTLSKALGSQGGFVVASQIVVDWLVNAARPFIYSTGLSPANCGAALKALEIVRREPQRQQQLREVTKQLANGLRELGYEARLQPSPIIPIVIGDASRALALSDALLQRGLWCPAIRPPTVPPGTSRLRLTANATWDDATIARILSIFSQVKNEF